MSFEQRWLIAMWAKVYHKFCDADEGDNGEWLLSVPESEGLLPIDEYFLNEPVASGGPDIEQLEGNANFSYEVNLIPHFAGSHSTYTTVWDAYERVFGQVDQRIAKFGLPKELVGTESGEQIKQQRQILLDSLTAPDRREYRETLLAVPHSLFDADTPWSTISVTASDVGAMLEHEPDFIKRMIGWDASDSHADLLSQVDNISFEISTATIIRPWLDLNQLQNRLWDWILKSTPELSDGGNPPKGDLPAIPMKIIFVRNAEVNLKPSTKPDYTKSIIKGLKFLPFMTASVKSPDLGGGSNPQHGHEPVPAYSVVFRPWLISAPQRTELASHPDIHSADAAILRKPMLGKVPGSPIMLPRANFKPLEKPQAGKSFAKPVRVTLGVRRQMFALKRPDGTRRPTSTTIKGKPPSPEGSQTSHASGFRDTQILAFLCRPLPKLPNPLPDIVFDA